MRRMMLAVILGAALFAACSDEPTGPSVDSGEVRLELFKSQGNSHGSTGEGYNFATGEKIKITDEEARYHIGELSDLDAFPGVIGSTDYALWAKPARMYANGERYNYWHLDYKEVFDFELTTLDGKSRYKINVRYSKRYWDEIQNGDISIFYFRYKLLSP
jgi:hypothetical protein